MVYISHVHGQMNYMGSYIKLLRFSGTTVN
jgi:hypothetical protein